MEDHGESVDLLLEHGPEGLDGDVAAGQTRAAGRDHDVDFGIGDPGAQLRRDLRPDRRAAVCVRRARVRLRVRRAASASPEVSFEASRVSETVSTAMRTGTKAIDSSMRCGGIADQGVAGRRLGVCSGATLTETPSLVLIVRPLALRRFVERGRIGFGALCVQPIIRHHVLDVVARLRIGNALDEEQRIVGEIGPRTEPARQRRRPGVVGGGKLEQISVRLFHQILQIALAETQIVRRDR